MRYNEPIYTVQDLVEEYTNGRKNIPQKEVEDLIRCLILFLKKDMRKGETPYYYFPRLGTLYKKFGEEEQKHHTHLFDIMMFELMFGEKEIQKKILTPRIRNPLEDED